MSMQPFLVHVASCSVCRAHPQARCAAGKTLLKEGAQRLTKQMIYDPRRARA